MEEGSKNVRLGTLIALLVEEGQDWKQVEIPADIGSDIPSQAPQAPAPPPTSGDPVIPAPSKMEPPPGKLQ